MLSALTYKMAALAIMYSHSPVGGRIELVDQMDLPSQGVPMVSQPQPGIMPAEQPAPVPQASLPPFGNHCSIPFGGVFGPGPAQPLGSLCWVTDVYGRPIQGQIVQ